MRYIEGRTPDEVVSALGITHRQYARLFERANTAINRKLLAYLAGDWCVGYPPKFARLAANRATATEARVAREHLAACPSCSAAYETFTRLHPSGAWCDATSGACRARSGVERSTPGRRGPPVLATSRAPQPMTSASCRLHR
jgi:hypothetical protein